MKKKLIISAVVFCAAIVVGWIVCRITGMLLFFSIPTPVNIPNINPGDRVLSSNLKEPQPYDFIIFTSSYSDSINGSYIKGYENGSKYLYRLCGLPDNVIEMKNGILYINNKKFDSGLNLNNQYKITNKEFYSIDEEDISTGAASGGMQMISNDTAVVTFDNKLLKKYQVKFKLVPFILNDATCFKWYNKNPGWTVDNFGPLKIPANSYFVLGDNRHNAMDSRYIGFVKKENIKGVVLNK